MTPAIMTIGAAQALGSPPVQRASEAHRGDHLP
jgi:hypothetical protein